MTTMKIRLFCSFCVISEILISSFCFSCLYLGSDRLTDRPTDRPTDWPTEWLIKLALLQWSANLTHKGTGICHGVLRINNRLMNTKSVDFIVFHWLFNRDLNHGCLVQMFSLCFSGSKFLINLRRQFGALKIFSCV